MRAFIIFMLFLIVLVQALLFARTYVDKDAASDTPLAERSRTTTAAQSLEPEPHENPTLGIEILRGTVSTLDRSPVSGAEITVVETDFDKFDAFRVPRKRDTWITKTAEGGTFSLDTLAPGGYVVRAVGTFGSAAALLTLDARGGAGETKLRLAPSRRVSGAVLNWEGKPLEGAHVFVLAPEGTSPELAPWRYLPVITEADGSFLFEGIPTLPVTFLAVADDHAPAIVREATDATEIPVPLRFTLGKGARLGGYLIETTTNRQAERAAVIATEREFGVERARKLTTGAGSFLFEDLRPGSYEITIESAHFTLESRPFVVDVRDGLGNIDVKVIKAGRIKGRVLHENGREGIPGVTIAAVSKDPIETRSEITGSTGYYSFDGLAPGAWLISVDAAQMGITAAAAPEVKVISGKTAVGPDFTLSSGATISGRVVDVDGRPVVGANVHFSLDGNRTPDRTSRSGEDGRFEQGGIPPESQVRVWAERLGKVSTALGPEPVSTAGLHELTFTLSEEATGLIAGTVVDTLGRPASGATVECDTPDVSLTKPLSLQTGADGAFRFEDLAKGVYTLQAGRAADKMEPASAQQLTLDSGQHSEDMRLVVP